MELTKEEALRLLKDIRVKVEHFKIIKCVPGGEIYLDIKDALSQLRTHFESQS